MNVLKSPILHYIGVRYIAYGLQFINSIFIAKFLGLYFFGIYSFIQLFRQYLVYFGMIPSYSLTTIMSTINKPDSKVKDDIFGASILNLIILNILAAAGVFILFLINPDIFSKYEFSRYLVYLMLISLLTSTNHLFINLYRSIGSIFKINFSELLIPISQISVLLFFRKENLLQALLLVTIVSLTLSIFVFLYKIPIKIRINLKSNFNKIIFSRGLRLLLYNISFTLILMMSRTFVSIYNNPEELGEYSFAVNLSNAVFMIVGSIGFVLYPKLLNKLSIIDNKRDNIREIRIAYNNGCFVLVLLSFFISPLLILLIPDFNLGIDSFKILLIAQFYLNFSFVYSLVLIARKKESILTREALISLIIMLAASFVFYYFNSNILFAVCAVFLALIYYSVRVAFLAKKVNSEQVVTSKHIFIEFFNLRYFIPVIILLLSVLLEFNILSVVAGLIFTFLNWSSLKSSFMLGKTIFLNKNALKI